MAMERKTTGEATHAIVVMVDMPDMTAELYDATGRIQGLDRWLPEGCLVHIAGPGPEGWRIVAAWESREKLQHFVTNTLRPAHAEVGVAPPSKPPVVWELYDLQIGSGAVDTGLPARGEA